MKKIWSNKATLDLVTWIETDLILLEIIEDMRNDTDEDIEHTSLEDFQEFIEMTINHVKPEFSALARKASKQIKEINFLEVYDYYFLNTEYPFRTPRNDRWLKNG